MIDDFIIVIIWCIFLFGSILPTAHLYNNIGVLSASQAIIIMIAALTDMHLLTIGISPVLSWIAASLIGLLLGILHVPILKQTGTPLFLILTAISHFILAEAWYAFPYLTGGSGGIVLMNKVNTLYSFLSYIILLAICTLYLRFVNQNTDALEWECIKYMGWKAEIYGVPSSRKYILAFSIYGLILGAIGATTIRIIGYLTITLYGITWSLAVVMIVLVCIRRHFIWIIVLSFLYSFIRVVLRNSLYTSPTWSHIFEIIFPLILLILAKNDLKYTIRRKQNERLSKSIF